MSYQQGIACKQFGCHILCSIPMGFKFNSETYMRTGCALDISENVIVPYNLDALDSHNCILGILGEYQFHEMLIIVEILPEYHLLAASYLGYEIKRLGSYILAFHLR